MSLIIINNNYWYCDVTNLVSLLIILILFVRALGSAAYYKQEVSVTCLT